MIPATQIREGMIIEWRGEPHRVTSMVHITPGNKRGIVQTKLLNLKTGTIYDNRFRSDDKVTVARLDTSEMEFIYQSGDTYTFMDVNTFEQHELSADLLGDTVKYLVPNIRVNIQRYQGKIVGIELPLTVEMRIKETEPPLKGATAAASFKPATLETGLIIKVPQFLNAGEVVKVDTRDGSFVERVQK